MNYRHNNALALAALLLLVPTLLLTPWLREQAGNLYPTCVLEAVAGHRCPLCGITTDLYNILTHRGSRTELNPLTVPVMVLFILEVATRTMLSFARLTPASIPRVKRWDLRLHAALVAAYLLYTILFFAGCAAG